jgi:hypothetical protein
MREARRKAARHHGAQVIIDQIADRNQLRIKEAEMREKEREIMRQNVEKMRLQEEKLA